MKILITGGLGNLGLWLTEAFLASGATVHVLGRSEKVKLSHPCYQFLQCDLTDFSSVSSAITGYYDVCIHAASYNEHFKPDYAKTALLTNALGTEYLCQRLSVSGVGKFVYLSTFHVYGAASGIVDEDTPINPNNDYGLTHFFAEKYIEKHNRTSGLKYTILRLTNSYGCPKDINSDKWYLLFNDLAKNAMQTRIIKLNSNGSAQRDFIWMGDVVNVIQNVVSDTSTDNHVFNLSAGVSLRLLDVANYVQSAYFSYCGEKIKIVVNESDKQQHFDLIVSNEKLKLLIDYKPQNMFLEESIKIFSLVENKI